MPVPNWSRPLPRPIIIPDVMKLDTLGDVRALVEKHLPAEYRTKFPWRQFAGMLRRAAEGNEDAAEVATALLIVLKIGKWRLKHRAVADSLEEAGDRLFTFARLPSQWLSARTTNAIERLHEEFKRRIKTQTVLPSADTAAMLFWALLASGQINMRKIDGWQTLATKPIDQPIDLAA